MSVRGCGTRKRGGIYSTCPLAAGGRPVEDFLIDPPLELEGPLAPQGVGTIVREGVTHIVDWVGSTHYPNVADFVEEVRRMGMSRRIPSTFDFSKLTRDSCHILVHARTIVAHPEMYRPALIHEPGHVFDGPMHLCPKFIVDHQRGYGKPETPPEMCAGIWWEDLDPCEYLGDGQDRKAKRRIPSGVYEGLGSPVEPRMREYFPGLFLMMPIVTLQIVRDAISGRHEEAAWGAGRAGIPTELVDE